jgi:hypothetical protein
MDRNILGQVLENKEYHVERRENVKNGVKDPFKNRFFTFINRCSTFFNIRFRRDENHRQIVTAPPELKVNLERHFRRDTLDTTLQRNMGVRMSVIGKLGILKSKVNNNRYLEVKYTAEIERVEGRMRNIQQRMKHFRESANRILSASKRAKNISEMNKCSNEYFEINGRVEQISQASQETQKYHDFLKKFQKDGVDVTDMLTREYQLKSNSSISFKNADFCEAFSKKIKFFVSSANAMEADPDFSVFGEKIREEFNSDLRTMVEYYRNSKNITNLNKVKDELSSLTMDRGEFNDTLMGTLKEIEVIIEQNPDVKVKKTSSYYSFLGNCYEELNKDSPERHSYAATKFFRGIFSTKYNPNREFDEMLKLSTPSENADNAEALIEKIKFIYNAFQKNSADPRFAKFKERIREEFEEDLNRLIKCVGHNNTAQVESINKLFAMERVDGHLLDNLMKMGEFAFNQALEATEFKTSNSLKTRHSERKASEKASRAISEIENKASEEVSEIINIKTKERIEKVNSRKIEATMSKSSSAESEITTGKSPAGRSHLSEIEEDAREVFSELADDLIECHETLFSAKNKKGGISKVLGFIAARLSSEEKNAKTLLNNINTGVKNLFKLVEGGDGDLLVGEIKKISENLQVISSIVKKRDDHLLTEKFESNIVGGVNEIFELLAEREIFVKGNNGKSSSFEEFFRAAVDINIRDYKINFNAIKKQKMIKKGEKESEQRRNAEIEKERKINAEIGEERIKNKMNTTKQNNFSNINEGLA